MSEAHSSSTAVAQTPTSDGLATYAPEWMDHVGFSVLTETESFEHRGHKVAPSRLVPQLENKLALDQQRGEISSQAHHTLAVRHVIETIKDHRESWFEGDHPLATNELIETYYDGVVEPAPQSFDLTNRDDRKRVVVPVAAVVLNAVAEQRRLDTQATIEDGRNEIYKRVLEIAHDRDLPREEVEAALENIRKTMDANPDTFGQ